MKKQLIVILALLLTCWVKAQELKSFKIYNKEHQEINFQTMINAIQQQQVVLFGEFHNSAIIHWLELKTAEGIYTKQPHLTLGAEMFETDNQLIFNEYLNDKISEENFNDEMRLWKNYTTDYKPLVSFAKKHQLKFIATNVPRRYASYVSKTGIDSLQTFTDGAQLYFAPLPIKVDTLTPGYGAMLKMMKGHSFGPNMNPMNFVAAQAVKDATMAYFIAQNITKNGVFLHYNGDYHSKNYGGIYWYLHQIHPDLKIAVITVEESNNKDLSLNNLEESGDYTIVIPSDFTKTYE
ncbi:ChaN family lipoprotein [Zhouia sp. PK063]|uniref:ChaN family lipoprotein n=1 Tax=Zhouia sp. PK063 TaxID=3373602 RepID=UPI0037873CAF